MNSSHEPTRESWAPSLALTCSVAACVSRPPARLIRVWRVPGEQRLDQCRPRRVGEVRWERARERLDVALEQESEIGDRPDPHQALVPALPLEHHGGRAAPCVAANRALAQLGTLYAGARHAEAVGEVAQRRSEEHTSELQSPYDLVCRLLLEKKNSHRLRG